MSITSEEIKQFQEACRIDLEARGIAIASDLIFEFIANTADVGGSPPRQASEESTKAAAAYLFQLIEAAKLGHDWNSYKKVIKVRKRRDNIFDPDEVDTNHPAFLLVAEYLQGKRKYEDTIKHFAENIQPADPRHIADWISDIRPRVESALEFSKNLQKSMVKKHP